MPSTGSDVVGKVVDIPSEQVVGMGRNKRSTSAGTSGRHESESVVAVARITPLRQWTKPDNHARVLNAALDLIR